MTNEEVAHIKRKLRDYRYYKSTMEYCQHRLDQIQYELSQVKGVSFDSVGGVGSYHSGAMTDRFYELIDDKEVTEDKMKACQQHIDAIYYIINQSGDPELLRLIYVDGLTLREAGEIRNYTLTSIAYHVRRAIEVCNL